MAQEAVSRVYQTRDFRKRLDVKDVDARGRRLVEDSSQQSERYGQGPTDGEPENRPEWLRMDGGTLEKERGGMSPQTRQEDIQMRLDRLESLVRDSLGQTREPQATKNSARKSQKQVGKSSDKTKQTNLVRSNSLGKRSKNDLAKTANPLTMNRTHTKNDPRLENEYVSRVRDSNFVLAKELGAKHGENEKLRGTVEAREKELGMAANGIDRLGMREDRLLQEVELLRQENRLLEEKNYQLRSQLQTTQQDRHSEGYLLLENDTLRQDLTRLVKMLQNTKEYKNFADYADASGGVHFLKSIGKFSRLDLACGEKQNIPLCQQPDLYVDEKVLWVPQEAYKFAHQFRQKYDGRMTEGLVEHLLYELNKIWNQREKRLLATVKSSYNNETEYLRRKIAHTPTAELTHLQSEIKRLRADLKNAYKDNRDLHVHRAEMNPPGMQYIKGAMKMATDYNTQKNKIEKHNRYLQGVAEAYQKVINEDYRGNIYLTEGIKTAHARDQQLAHSLRHEVNQLLHEYENKALTMTGTSKSDIQKLDQTRDHYLTLVKRKLEGFCNQLDKEHKGAHTAIDSTKDKLGLKK